MTNNPIQPELCKKCGYAISLHNYKYDQSIYCHVAIDGTGEVQSQPGGGKKPWDTEPFKILEGALRHQGVNKPMTKEFYEDLAGLNVYIGSLIRQASQCACDDEGPCKLHGQLLSKWLAAETSRASQEGEERGYSRGLKTAEREVQYARKIQEMYLAAQGTAPATKILACRPLKGEEEHRHG